MASSSSSRATFYQSAAAFVRRIGFDGFDLEWEYPSSGDKANFAALLTEMANYFAQEATSSGKPRLLLTAAVAAGISKIQAGYDGTAVGQSLDYLNLMSYDFHGSLDTTTGFNSPLYDVNGDKMAISNAAQYWNSISVPKSKILIGLGTYGRGFTLASSSSYGVGASITGGSPAQTYTQEAGYAAYYEICALGYTQYYSSAQVSPYAVGSGYWYRYDTVTSFNAKLDWIIANAYRGAFLWALDLDDFRGQCPSSNGQKFPLLNAIKAKLI